jgi:hypothetical protein
MEIWIDCSLLIGETPELETEQHQTLSQACTRAPPNRRAEARCPSTSMGCTTCSNASSPIEPSCDTVWVQQTSVGLEAEPPQFRLVLQQLADAEVACVVDGGFGAEGTTFLMIVLDARALVGDVPRGDHTVGNDARSEFSGSAADGSSSGK